LQEEKKVMEAQCRGSTEHGENTERKGTGCARAASVEEKSISTSCVSMRKKPGRLAPQRKGRQVEKPFKKKRAFLQCKWGGRKEEVKGSRTAQWFPVKGKGLTCAYQIYIAGGGWRAKGGREKSG